MSGNSKVDHGPGENLFKIDHQRLEKNQIAVDHSSSLDAEAKAKILKSRAKCLAMEADHQTTGRDYVEVVEFLMADEKYAIETRYIGEVLPLREITPLPCTPSFISGVINVRGEILAVTNLRQFFNLPMNDTSNLTKVILISTEEMETCILADATLGVRNIPVENIQPTLPTFKGLNADYISGITNERVVILNVEKILGDKRFLVNDTVEGAAV